MFRPEQAILEKAGWRYNDQAFDRYYERDGYTLTLVDGNWYVGYRGTGAGTRLLLRKRNGATRPFKNVYTAARAAIEHKLAHLNS